MAARLVLFFLFFCGVERSGTLKAAGLSEEDEDLQAVLSKKQQVLPHPDSVDILFVRLKELGSRGQETDDVITPASVAFQQSDRNPGDFDLSNPNKLTDSHRRPESAAASLMHELSPEVTVSHMKRSNMTNEEDEDVINGHSLVPRSEEVNAVRPELYVDHDAQPERTWGGSKWVTESYQPEAEPRPRRRRSWLWNQFFVIEEYRGPEPVLIGRLHTDMDRGDGHTKYVLEGEGVGSVFVIDSNTGNIHVTKSLDREEKDQYRLTATALDRETGRALEPSSEFIIRVQDINDNPPVFPDEPYVAMVPEMANIGTADTRALNP